jgi:hypothetical protein
MMSNRGKRALRQAAKQSAALTIALMLALPPGALGDERTDVATSALEFGGSVGRLLWVAVKDNSAVSPEDANRYTELAVRIKEQIDLGRASSSLVKANFNVIGTTLAYGAAVDPEPLSKAVTGIAAWGAKKAGDALGDKVIEESQKQAKGILAQGLKNTGLSPAELKNMTADQLRGKVADLKVGGQTLRDVLKDDPDSLSMLQANAVDIATNIGVEELARSEGTAANVKTIQDELGKTTTELHAFQDEVKKHLETVDTRLSVLEGAVETANKKLDDLTKQVQGNSKAIQTLTQISYSGWSTAQKLQAVEGGLFPDLTKEQQAALVESLKADKAREEAVAGIQQAARDFGNLAAIASNIGLPRDLVTGLQGAQIVATGIAQFATGDILGSLSSVTSLVGLGAPDAAAERYAAMMKYLEQEFKQVNAKLDKIIELQVQTLKAIAALAADEQKFHSEVLGQLDRIEKTVLQNQQLLQAILLNQWTDCNAFINGRSLNGQYSIPTRDVLLGVINDLNTRSYATNAAGCYSQMNSFLDAWVKSANWSAQIISADHFPSASIAPDSATQKGWSAFMSERINAYTLARDFVLQALPSDSPAAHLVRFSQPVVNTSFSGELASALAKNDVRARLTAFKCTDTDVMSPGLRDLICFGRVNGDSSPPLPDRWQDLLRAASIGPQSITVIQTGITLSTIADFAQTDAQGSFSFVKPTTLEKFSQDGATTQLRNALQERKGISLLEKLRWLTEADVLQQSIASGDYTSQLVERALYDPTTKSLNTDVKAMTPLKSQALSAMRYNPVLARNVVLLAMRHAITDSLGGPDKAESVLYEQTYYNFALQQFTGPQACNGDPDARKLLGELFPNWQFEYWITADQKQNDKQLANCSSEFTPDANGPSSQAPARGSGVGVTLGDFYVLAPTPLVLSSGLFELSDSLRLALAYRDRLNQAIIDRNLALTVKELSGAGQESSAIAERTSFALLNAGWGWQTRKKSQ